MHIYIFPTLANLGHGLAFSRLVNSHWASTVCFSLREISKLTGLVQQGGASILIPQANRETMYQLAIAAVSKEQKVAWQTCRGKGQRGHAGANLTQHGRDMVVETALVARVPQRFAK